MPRRAEEWTRDSHPPYCTCASCVQERMSRWETEKHEEGLRALLRQAQPRPPSRRSSRRSGPIRHSTPARLRRRPRIRIPVRLLVIVGIVAFGVAIWAEASPAYDSDVARDIREWFTDAAGDIQDSFEVEPLDASTIEELVIQHTNQERTTAGLRPLVHDPAISDIARAHSEDMINYGLFHDIKGKNPTDRALSVGYTCRAFRGDGSYSYGLSENIYEYPRRAASGFLDSESMARALVAGWMRSLGHRANIMDKDARRIGVGVAINSEYGETVFATQNFSECE